MAAVGLGALLVMARAAESPLDDPDPARQRPGLLDVDALPLPAPEVAPGIPAPGRRAVVFFERPDRVAALCRSLGRTTIPKEAVVVVVVSERTAKDCGPGVRTISDTGGLGRAFGLPSPRDGGPPVGYAVVDAGGRIRYRTLDPSQTEELQEVVTILEAVV
ncbi:MAG: hypothetical protein ACRDJP_03810 [Actinomycetota bacterium]